MEDMKTWKVELTARGITLAEVKIQRGIFQGDALSTLLLITAMMLLIYILRIVHRELKFTKSQENINHPVYMESIKVFVKNEKELESLIQTIRIYRQNIGLQYGIEKCIMLILNSGKRKPRKI